MTKIVLPVLAAFFALSTPAFASAVIYQDEPVTSSQGQPVTSNPNPMINLPGGPAAEQGLDQEKHPNQSE